MDVPFSTGEFLGVFARYNQAVWPAQVVFVAVAVLAVLLALRPSPGAGRAVVGVLASFWAWMGAVYHALFFTAINPAAYLFAILFVAQAALLAAAAAGEAPTFRLRADARGITGVLLLAYALAGYPAVGYLLGHRYPHAPTFGLPCPTTIFTLGLLLWAERLPVRLLIIPVAWSLVGSTAAGSLGMGEDYALLPAAAAALVLALPRGRAASRPTAAAGELPGGHAW
jgi:hypothetical protein